MRARNMNTTGRYRCPTFMTRFNRVGVHGGYKEVRFNKGGVGYMALFLTNGSAVLHDIHFTMLKLALDLFSCNL